MYTKYYIAAVCFSTGITGIGAILFGPDLLGKELAQNVAPLAGLLTAVVLLGGVVAIVSDTGDTPPPI